MGFCDTVIPAQAGIQGEHSEHLRRRHVVAVPPSWKEGEGGCLCRQT